MIDRFGTLPEETDNLLKVIEIKLNCRAAQVAKLDVGAEGRAGPLPQRQLPRPRRPDRLCPAPQGHRAAAARQQAGDHPRLARRAEPRLNGALQLSKGLARILVTAR